MSDKKPTADQKIRARAYTQALLSNPEFFKNCILERLPLGSLSVEHDSALFFQVARKAVALECYMEETIVEMDDEVDDLG